LTILTLISLLNAALNIPISKWEREWNSGDWDYLENVAAERARIAVIGGVFTNMYAASNASVLDIGCGEGAISDFLTFKQKSSYVGVDFSKEAIKLAKSKRHSPMKFVHASADEFNPTHKFDVIIFSEVLYYVDHEKVIQKYIELLNPNGIIIISIFHPTEKLLYENIFQYARSVLTLIDEMEISGLIRKKKNSNLEKTHFHIEVYQEKKLS
jgi:2-polyprenyl-3-methyl-5-hydroxy-6-metoxy-1,4-benzoquinol methylase